ncbi:MAG TPA: polyprenyl synthetase family protein [Micropepsaceae bacterium]|nr:polyprenyl synthetase family protein [Micropepsaceae bacterium]
MGSAVRVAPIEPAIAETATFLDATLDALLPHPLGPEARLIEAMRYATMGGTQRLRGFLVLQSGRLFGVDRRALGRVAVAVECLHASSVIRDDLPTDVEMEPRQAKPAVHKAFDRRTARLASDTLLMLAPALLASPETHGDPFVRCDLVGKLTSAGGYGGMTGGRMIEAGIGAEEPGFAELTRMARMKTAALITFCCESGAILAKASSSARQALIAYGQELGLACEISVGIAASGASLNGAARNSVAALLGCERAQTQADALAAQAASHLDLFDEKADLLRAAASFITTRQA